MPARQFVTRPFVMGLSLVAAAIACDACAHAAGSAAAQSVVMARNPNVITEAELRDPDIRDLNVLEVVRKLRPNYLADRGAQSTQQPESGKVHASVDGIAVIPLDYLRSIYANSIVEIQFLNAGAAMQRFGGYALAGPVILVRTTP